MNIGISSKDVLFYKETHHCSLEEAKIALEKKKLLDMAAGACQYNNMSALYPVIAYLIERLK